MRMKRFIGLLLAVCLTFVGVSGNGGVVYEAKAAEAETVVYEGQVKTVAEHIRNSKSDSVMLDMAGKMSLDKDLINALRGTDKTLCINLDKIRWRIDLSTIASAGSDFDLSLMENEALENERLIRSELKKLGASEKAAYYEFGLAQQGGFPFQAEVMLTANGWLGKQAVAVQLADQGTHIVAGVKTDKSGSFTFLTDRGGSYFLMNPVNSVKSGGWKLIQSKKGEAVLKTSGKTTVVTTKGTGRKREDLYIKKSGLSLEKDGIYRAVFSVKADRTGSISVRLGNRQQSVKVSKTYTTVSLDVTMKNWNQTKGDLLFLFGNSGSNHTFSIKDVSVVKIMDGTINRSLQEGKHPAPAPTPSAIPIQGNGPSSGGNGSLGNGSVTYDASDVSKTVEQIKNAQGAIVNVNLPAGVTTVSAEFFNGLKGESKTVSIQAGSVSWSIPLYSIEDMVKTNIDLNVKLNDTSKSAQIEQNLTSGLQMALTDYFAFTYSHHGALPFTAEVTIPAGSAWAGKEVTIYKSSDPATVYKGAVVTADSGGNIRYLTNSLSTYFIIPTASAAREYHEVWKDDFDGVSLDTAKWTGEKRNPGYTNNELQEYTDSADNIYLDGDGHLVLKAIKEDRAGKPYYTSGKVVTKGKKDIKYGKIEVKAKLPKGQGIWPAIWMMPTNEGLYGQWPKCGEIDIMELLGHEPDKIYGTLHYGEPHTEQQGSYTLKSGDFSNDYHTFMVEWEPDSMRFYVDGYLFKTVNDWFTKAEGGEEITYPAPFDQEFFVQLNLAVGGDWPGNPDETTDFSKAEMYVDYVKIYQKDFYQENVLKPVKEPEKLREPDSTGNYILNGNFSDSNLNGNTWNFLTALGGVGQASIAGNQITITTENAGTADYSVQLLQGGLPLQKGFEYKLTFDAKAEADRTIITDISAPEHNWIRYLQDTKLNLTTQKKTYSYTFIMTGETDGKARLEFNMGNQGSTAGVAISNVSVKKTGNTVNTPDSDKTVQPDGNYVYNGRFNLGNDRLKYWTTENNAEDGTVAVTNQNGENSLMAAAPTDSQDPSLIRVFQEKLALSAGGVYTLTFYASGDEGKVIRIQVGNESFDITLTSDRKLYKQTFPLSERADGIYNIELLLGSGGTSYIDHVRLAAAGLINGDFSDGLSGWIPFVDFARQTDVTYGVDTSGGDSAAEFTIKNAAVMNEWDIQLQQKPVMLEKDQYYKLTFNARSDMNRNLKIALQRDGTADDQWTVYSSGDKVLLGNQYQTYTEIFQMKQETDSNTILTFSLGNMEGVTNQEHHVWIDNVKLEEMEHYDPDNLLQNGEFEEGGTGWKISAGDNGALNPETEVFENGQAVFDITSVGDQEYSVLLETDQTLPILEGGADYQIRMNIASQAGRPVKLAFLDGTNSWCGGAGLILNGTGEMTEYGVDRDGFYWGPSKSFADVRKIQIFMGNVDSGCVPGRIVFESIYLEKKSSQLPPNPEGVNLLKNADLTGDSQTDWLTEGGVITVSGGAFNCSIDQVGPEDYSVQIKQDGITLEKNKWYRASFTVNSDTARTIRLKLQENGGSWAVFNNGGTDFQLQVGANTCEVVFQMTGESIDKVLYGIMLGNVGNDPGAHHLVVGNMSLVKYSDEPS